MATTTTDDNEELIRTVLAAFGDRDFDAVAAAHADDVVVHDDGTTYRGYDAVEEHMAGSLRAVDDPAFTVEEVLADDDGVACRYTVSATVDGTRTETTALSFARVEDGLLAEVWVESISTGDDETQQPADAEAANVRVVRSLYEAASDGEFDVEAFLAPLAADVEWIEPAGSPVGGVHRGRDGVLELVVNAKHLESLDDILLPPQEAPDGDSDTSEGIVDELL